MIVEIELSEEERDYLESKAKSKGITVAQLVAEVIKTQIAAASDNH